MSISWLALLALIGALQGLLITSSVFLTTRALRVLARRSPRLRRIQRTAPKPGTERYEIRYTTISILSGVLLAAVTVSLIKAGRISVDTSQRGPLTVILQCLGYLLGLDAYQYLIHRLMHTRILFRHVHHVHHRSRTPSALSAFSFHPIEFIALGLYFPLTLSIFEFSVHSMAILCLIQFFMNTIPHCGYEFAPSWWYRHRVGRLILTPYFHDVHHQVSSVNYGACTTIWDRLLGTIQPGFERGFVELLTTRGSIDEERP